jgi:dynactin 1
MSIEKLTRKLEDATSMLHRKEREFEATLEHFQTDIESLEMEKGELRDKLMSATKRTLLDGLVKSAATTPLQSPGHASAPSSQGQGQGQTTMASAPTGPASSGMIEYTRYLQRQNWKLKSEKTAKALKKLPPLKSSNIDAESLKSLDKEFWILKREWISILGETVKLSFDKTLSKSRREYYVGLNEIKKKQLMEKMAILKEKINLELAERKSDYIIKADFTSFSKDTSSKENKDTVKVASLKFPGWEKSQEAPKRIVLSEEQIQHLHHILTPFN